MAKGPAALMISRFKSFELSRIIDYTYEIVSVFFIRFRPQY